MTEATCHTLHIDKAKGTIIVGYVGSARDGFNEFFVQQVVLHGNY